MLIRYCIIIPIFFWVWFIHLYTGKCSPLPLAFRVSFHKVLQNGQIAKQQYTVYSVHFGPSFLGLKFKLFLQAVSASQCYLELRMCEVMPGTTLKPIYMFML